jgi:nitroreductase
MGALENTAGVPGTADNGVSQNVIDTIIAGRFACREFSDRPVSRRMIEEILAIARFAPSGGNIQPWRVYVLAGRAKDRVSAALLKAHRESRNEHLSEYKYYTAQLPAAYFVPPRGMGAESEAKRPPIPTESGHRFRSKAATQSDRKRPPC